MPTPQEIFDTSASFLNDTAQSLFTDAVQLPYFNQALRDLQERYELNDVPVTHETSAALTILAGNVGVTRIGYGTNPALPYGLLEIKQLWESPAGQDIWTRMTPRGFLPQQMLNSQIPQFLIYAWENDEIHVFTANQDNDIKIDYIKSLFLPVQTADITSELGLKFNRCYSYLAYRTASLCALYIGENPSRATELNIMAEGSMAMALGIATKGKQGISTRRLPFRFAFKNRGFRW